MNTLRIDQLLAASLAFLLLLSITSCQPQGKHVFIMSGQSNMANLNVQEYFLPSVAEALGEENVIVVKHAKGSQPIRRWYQAWQAPSGSNAVAQPYLYDSLMNKVYPAIADQQIASVTFTWMQGKRDARMNWGDVYAASLRGLYDQLSEDLGRHDINFVIGRLSDFGFDKENYAHWTKIRDTQMEVADSNPRFSWVNSDDLNDGININGKEAVNNIHMSEKGIPILGKRFAEEAIRLIKEN